MPAVPASPTPQRPQLKPGLRRVWRDHATVQIGLTPDAGVVVAGLAPAEMDLLDLLDGTRPLPELTDWAATRGLPADRVSGLLRMLDQAGVLTGPPTDRAHLHQLGEPDRRRLQPDALAWSVTYPDAGDGFGLLALRAGHRVLVVGRSRLARSAEAALRRIGVVGQSLSPERLSAESVADSVASPGRRVALVLLVDEDAAAGSAGALLLGQQVPHLAAVGGADRAVVGPLVVPGRSACLRCLELHRTDRDPGWPTVSAQLGAAPSTARGESSLTELVAGLVALQVACWVDGRRTPASLGATVTVTLPDGLTARRAWTPHPRCGCSWLAASLPVPLGVGGPTTDRGQ
jgi:bacteriocin biosynthesis cyclodehydratase domain-containing protein